MNLLHTEYRQELSRLAALHGADRGANVQNDQATWTSPFGSASVTIGRVVDPREHGSGGSDARPTARRSMILLVPAAAHREALLGDGACGAHPPVVLGGDGDPWGPTSSWERDAPDDWEYALALVWEGAPAVEGCERAACVSGWDGGPLYCWDIGDAEVLAEFCAAQGLGTVVTLENTLPPEAP